MDVKKLCERSRFGQIIQNEFIVNHAKYFVNFITFDQQ